MSAAVSLERPAGAAGLASPPLPGVGRLREAYTTGRLTVAEVVDLVLRRISQSRDEPVWISRLDEAMLRRRADDLDAHAAFRGDLLALPLFGIPFAVKDNLDVSGLPTTAGCPAFAYRPTTSAPVVDRLLDAGAVVVGKTNLDQFATGLTGTRSPYGICQSVFGGGLISGGSSSGSAVAVAAGQVSFALGTDTAGSGRVPAAMNGIVGLKPTRGLLSTTGLVPACRSLDCVSVFTHTVADAMDVLAVAEAVDIGDPWSRRRPGVELAFRPLEGWRVGLPALSVADFFGDIAMLRAFTEVVQPLVRSATVRTVDLTPLLEAGSLLYHGPWVAERLSGLAGFLERAADALLPITRHILESGRGFDAADTFRAQHRLRELMAATARMWEQVDALVLPTLPTTFTVDEIAEQPMTRNEMLGRFTQFANLLDCAAVSVPAGATADGRPAGLSVVGPAFSEIRLAALAASLAVPCPTPTED